jgi:antitoxin StbD
MMDAVFANTTVSVTELKRNYASIIKQSDESPIAILNHNRPESYLLPAAFYEKLLTRLEDLEDSQLIIERANGPFVDLSIDDL